MGNCLKTMGNCFCTVYPYPMVEVKPAQARHVRYLCFVATLMHLFLVYVAIFITGPAAFVINLLMALWISSAYLNMIEKVTWIYMTLLLL